jgi:chromate transporter
MIYWQLVAVFGVLSVLGFGGGNAIVPQMYADVVTQNHWVTAVDFSRFYALSRLAPGPAMSVSALIGYTVAGLGGAAVAAVAMFLPAAAFVYVLAHAWDRFRDHPGRKIFARAMIPIVLGLSWVGAMLLGRGALDGPATIAIALIAAVIMVRTKFNTALVIALAGVAGAVIFRGTS